MTVTYQQFAEHLLKHSNFYYRPHETVYCYIREDGAVRYFANWGYGETRDYTSLKSLMENTTGRDLPDADDLAAEAVNSPTNRKRRPRAIKEGTFPTCASIGIERDDNDFAILGTLNNTDNLMEPDDFKTIVRALARNIAAATAEPVRAFERQDAPDYVSMDGTERLIVESVAATPADSDTISVNRIHLRSILDYLHDSEADHYDPETYPDDVNDHVYSHVLAIEADLTAIKTDRAKAPTTQRLAITNDVLCELAHNLTVRECRIRDVTVDASEADDHDGESRYTDEAEGIFNTMYDIAWTVLEPYCAKRGAQ